MDTELVEKSVERLFPPGCSAVWRPREVSPDCRFWIIPGREGPRWIVPRDPRLGWPLVKQWRPYDPLSRGKWALLTAAYRAGRLGHVPGVVPLGIAGADAADWSVAGWEGDEAPVPVIYIGTPGPTQKAIATLVEQNSHEPTAVAKAPLGPRAAAGILREADVLGQLAVEKPGIAPRALFVDRERGYTMQEAVCGAPTGTSLTEAHGRWLARLCVPGTETSFRELTDALKRRIACITELDGTWKRHLNTVLEQVARSDTLRSAWVHGDFAPWNLRCTRSGELAAFDWEFAEPRGVPGLDAVHFLCRVLMVKGEGESDVRRLERRVLEGLTSAILRNVVDSDNAYNLWTYYVVWYQIVLLENGIINGYGEIFSKISQTWTNEPLPNTTVSG